MSMSTSALTISQRIVKIIKRSNTATTMVVITYLPRAPPCLMLFLISAHCSPPEDIIVSDCVRRVCVFRGPIQHNKSTTLRLLVSMVHQIWLVDNYKAIKSLQRFAVNLKPKTQAINNILTKAE